MNNYKIGTKVFYLLKLRAPEIPKYGFHGSYNSNPVDTGSKKGVHMSCFSPSSEGCRAGLGPPGLPASALASQCDLSSVTSAFHQHWHWFRITLLLLSGLCLDLCRWSLHGRRGLLSWPYSMQNLKGYTVSPQVQTGRHLLSGLTATHPMSLGLC